MKENPPRRRHGDKSVNEKGDGLLWFGLVLLIFSVVMAVLLMSGKMR